MTISVWWLILTAVVSGLVGFLWYSMFTVAKWSDEDSAVSPTYRHFDGVDKLEAAVAAAKKVEKTEWRYSVSYAYTTNRYSTGFGQYEAVCEKPITLFSEVENLREQTRSLLTDQNRGIDTIVILNWIELKG